MLRSSSAALLAAALALQGCAELPTDYLQPSPWTWADRQLQGRRFDGIDEAQLLSAAVAVLQDLGFTLEISHAELGFVQGSMQRDAKAPQQWVMLLALAALAGAGGGAPPVPAGKVPEEQTTRVLLSVRPARAGDARSHLVLVTFHRQLRQPLWHEAGTLRDPRLYQSFFEHLSKALFLEAHKL